LAAATVGLYSTVAAFATKKRIKMIRGNMQIRCTSVCPDYLGHCAAMDHCFASSGFPTSDTGFPVSW